MYASMLGRLLASMFVSASGAPCASPCCAIHTCATTWPKCQSQCCLPWVVSADGCDLCLKQNGCMTPTPRPVPTPKPTPRPLPTPPAPPTPKPAHPAEWLLLCDMYLATQAGDGWTASCKSGWEWCATKRGNVTDCCQWNGVRCNTERKITALNLGGCNLQGMLPQKKSVFSLPIYPRISVAVG